MTISKNVKQQFNLGSTSIGANVLFPMILASVIAAGLHAHSQHAGAATHDGYQHPACFTQCKPQYDAQVLQCHREAGTEELYLDCYQQEQACNECFAYGPGGDDCLPICEPADECINFLEKIIDENPPLSQCILDAKRDYYNCNRDCQAGVRPPIGYSPK